MNGGAGDDSVCRCRCHCLPSTLFLCLPVPHLPLPAIYLPSSSTCLCISSYRQLPTTISSRALLSSRLTFFASVRSASPKLAVISATAAFHKYNYLLPTRTPMSCVCFIPLPLIHFLHCLSLSLLLPLFADVICFIHVPSRVYLYLMPYFTPSFLSYICY